MPMPLSMPPTAKTLNYAPRSLEHAPAVLVWDKLTVKSKKMDRPLLNSVSGR